MQSSSAQALWETFIDTRDKDIKEELIKKYIPLVRHIIHRLHVNLPPYLDYEDLISYGILGLLQAIDRYDVSKNIKFETFAYSRIKGAIIDELRRNDGIPQSVKDKAKSLRKAYEFLEQKLGRTVTDKDISEHLKITPEELQAIYEEISILSNVVSIEDVVLIDVSRHTHPELQAELEDLKLILAKAIDLLPPQEKLVITLYYYEGLTFKEISQVMNLSQGRISQLHSKAVLRLRGRLSRRKADL